MEPIASRTREQEKWNAALSSVVAAVVLTGFKIVVGLMTNSLGILSEAAHSGLDLLAALITLLAVRVSDRPADKGHPYGYGKVENLSALFETLLLLVTCIWIISEAVERLSLKRVHVDASFWAFAVMIASIVIDISRARILTKAARKHKSQALEADALHFSTDIWSSAVVIMGLVLVRMGAFFPEWSSALTKADAVAALGVATIVVYVSLQLGERTIMGLLDTAPTGLREKIKSSIERLPGVAGCHRLRVRKSGPYMFVDVHVLTDGNKTLYTVHALTDVIEASIRRMAPDADVMVHPEPAPTLAAPASRSAPPTAISTAERADPDEARRGPRRATYS